MRASEQDGTFPRPQLCRGAWNSLDGSWRFAYDDAGVGETERWFDVMSAEAFDRDIVVPFPPESPASGIHDQGFHPVVWYRRAIESDVLRGDAAAGDDRALIHFGAVDHCARVWFDGQLVGEHVGGQTPFTVDVSDLITSDAKTHVLVVRAEDDPSDTAQPRGKQDWELEPHDIWYHRTTGIWQPVWSESVPALRVVDLAWLPDPAAGSVRAEVSLSARPHRPVTVEAEISLTDEVLADVAVQLDGRSNCFDIALPALRNGQERARFLWSPDHPVLLDVAVTVREPETGAVLDRVTSYVGMRSASVGGGHFLLNDRPYYLRSVLDQGYSEQTHLAAPDADSLRRDVELIKAMGFNAVRVHQKAEDPRFLYWADCLGLLVWAETANADEFSAPAVELLTREWIDLVRRDRSHPCIITWVPLNESWGVPGIADDPRQQQYSIALAALTRALDPTRPVLSNEGWEHLDSDVLGVHDYSTDPDDLRAHYDGPDAIRRTLDGHGPQGRRLMLGAAQRRAYEEGNAALMVTEFGGISLAEGRDTWGYGQVDSPAEYTALLRGLFSALHACEGVVGFCYTQFLDTAQETNGLLYADRSPKIPVEAIREIVTGLS